MRLFYAAITCLFILPLAAACSSDDDDHSAYDTYQDCFDDHTVEESLPIQKSIVICCLDHPIGIMDNPVCGNSTADCATYLGTNLSQPSVTSGDITAACQDYVNQKNM